MIINKSKELRLPLLMTTNWQAKMVSVAKKYGMTLIVGSESTYDPTTNTMNKTGNVATAIDPQRSDRILFLLRPTTGIEDSLRRNR